jgi:hypothetical protein
LRQIQRDVCKAMKVAKKYEKRFLAPFSTCRERDFGWWEGNERDKEKELFLLGRLTALGSGEGIAGGVR